MGRIPKHIDLEQLGSKPGNREPFTRSEKIAVVGIVSAVVCSTIPESFKEILWSIPTVFIEFLLQLIANFS